MTRDVSTVSCVKRRGVEVLEKIRGYGHGGPRTARISAIRSTHGRRRVARGGEERGTGERGSEAELEDDGDRGRWTVRESARRGFQGTRTLRGTPWERHSGQTDTDIETRLPTIR